MKIPVRYRDYFIEVAVDTAPVVTTAVGLRAAVGYRWRCERCGTILKQNTAAANSHVMKHVRQAEKEAKP